LVYDKRRKICEKCGLALQRAREERIPFRKLPAAKGKTDIIRILPQGFGRKWLTEKGMRRFLTSFVAIRNTGFLLTHRRFGTS
jgi:hypothetical protein